MAAALSSWSTSGVKYKTTVKDPGTPGILRMNEDRFSFTPDDPRSAMKLNVEFRGIKGHKFNKVDGSKPAPPLLNLFKDSNKGGCYIFWFDNIANRDLCRDFVGLLLSPQHNSCGLLPFPPRRSRFGDGHGLEECNVESATTWRRPAWRPQHGSIERGDGRMAMKMGKRGGMRRAAHRTTTTDSTTTSKLAKQALIAIEKQKVAEEEAETQKKISLSEAEKNAQVSKILMEQKVMEKDSSKRQQQIDNEMFLAREKALPHANYYRHGQHFCLSSFGLACPGS